MSYPYQRNPSDTLSLIAIDDVLLDNVSLLARSSERKRSMVRFHEFADPVQRMLNAIEPGTYVQPHRHANPDKPEVFVALRGRVLVVRFEDGGNPVEGVIVDAGGPVRGIEVSPGAWHSFFALQAGTVLFEVTEGPYDAATNKEFAPWAPPEQDTDASRAYIAGIRAHFEHLLPEIAALDQIEAEENEIC